MLTIKTASQNVMIESLKAQIHQLRAENVSQKAEIQEMRSLMSTQSAQMAMLTEKLEKI